MNIFWKIIKCVLVVVLAGITENIYMNYTGVRLEGTTYAKMGFIITVAMFGAWSVKIVFRK